MPPPSNIFRPDAAAPSGAIFRWGAQVFAQLFWEKHPQPGNCVDCTSWTSMALKYASQTFIYLVTLGTKRASRIDSQAMGPSAGCDWLEP